MNNGSAHNGTLSSSQSQQTITAFALLFRGRTDAWGRLEGGCVREPVTLDNYQRHLAGKESLGVYMLMPDQVCYFAAVDVDRPPKSTEPAPFDHALRIRNALYDLRLPSYIARSKSGDWHVYLFAEEKFNAEDIVKVLKSVLRQQNLNYEVFPKQVKGVELGNYINLPYFGNSRPFVEAKVGGRDIPVEYFVTYVRRIPEADVKRLVLALAEENPKEQLGERGKRKRRTEDPPCITAILKGVPEGCRDEAAFALSRYLLNKGLLNEEVEAALITWDERNSPPLGGRTIREKLKSASKGYPFGCGEINDNAVLKDFCLGKENCTWFTKTTKEGSRREEKGQSQANGLVTLALEAYLFHTPQGQPFAKIKVNKHWENWPCRSKGFKQWLGRNFYEQHGKVPNTEAINSALNVIEGIACFDNSCAHEVYNRVAWHNGNVYYDLSNEQWETICISSDRWGITRDVPVFFRRYAHQAPQSYPVHVTEPDSELNSLFQLINVRPDYRLLFKVSLITFFVPDIPHVLFMPYGPQGCGKSWLFCIIKQLIDPSTMKHLSLPSIHRELVQTLDHHWVSFFDNITYLTDWQKDCLCRAATGDGFQKRTLYSDEDDIIFSFKRCCGINAINLIDDRADLLDRALILPLSPIDKEQRRDETTLWQHFLTLRPRLLGACFAVLSKAITVKPKLQVSQLPRMADYALWGCAIAEALGYGQKAFMEAYEENIKNRQQSIVDASLVAGMLIKFMDNRGEWSGSPTELLSLLSKFAEDRDVNIKTKEWPKAPNSLTRTLNTLKESLSHAGVNYEVTHTGREKILKLSTFKRIKNSVSIVSQSYPQYNDNTNGFAQSITDTVISDGGRTNDIDDIFNTPKDKEKREGFLGMTIEQAVVIWRKGGAPVIHLGLGENCFNLEKLLSSGNVKHDHLEIVKNWLWKHQGKANEGIPDDF